MGESGEFVTCRRLHPLKPLERPQHAFDKYTIQKEHVVVVPSGSCAAMVKVEFPHLFPEDSVWRGRALELAARTFEFSDFLVNQLSVLDVRALFDGRVAYHFACHLRLLNQADAVEQLIGHVKGATCVTLPRQDQCCGFGGSFAVRYSNLSGAMVDDKVSCVLRTGADLLVSTDNGCLMNIEGRLRRAQHRIETLHLAELLDRS